MAVIYVCDACGKHEQAVVGKNGQWFKPMIWWRRPQIWGEEHACSVACVEVLKSKLGDRPRIVGAIIKKGNKNGGLG